jgi:cation:H+ antiporter
LTYLLILAGLVLLVVGGDVMIRGAVSAARGFGVSPLMIGLTLVAFGTSTPELVTSLDAALAGAPGIAVGNVVGSNICNILLILGIAALIKPVGCDARGFRRDGPALALATVAGIVALQLDALNRVTGALFLLGIVAYTVFTYFQERDQPSAQPVEEPAEEPMSLKRALALAAVGLAGVMLGANLLVDGSITLAKTFGVSDALIGLTIVAVGTSLPELVASVVAAYRGHSDVAYGNILGSNLYNILAILGATALIHPIPVAPEIAAFDGWVMLAATAAMIWFTITGWRITRLEGGAMLAAYVAYLGVLGGGL